MGRLSHGIFSLGGSIRYSARVGGLILLSMLLLGSPSAGALPVASGSNCNSNWVNNAGAMDCFIQGEEDLRNGVAHPHYVACSKAGEVFCCVDNDQGQNCEAVRAGRQPIDAVKLGAILDAQQSILTILGRMSTKVDNLESQVGDLKRKCPP
jgi:hypothetical protein